MSIERLGRPRTGLGGRLVGTLGEPVLVPRAALWLINIRGSGHHLELGESTLPPIRHCLGAGAAGGC